MNHLIALVFDDQFKGEEVARAPEDPKAGPPAPGAGNIWKLDPKTKQATIFRSPSGQAAGTKFDAEGNLVIAEG